MLRVQRANNVNMPLPTLPSFPPHTLLTISPYPLIPLTCECLSTVHLSFPQYLSYREKKVKEHTLHPSHIFFTELLTFIPRTCSPILLCSIAIVRTIGLRSAVEVRHENVLVVADCRSGEVIEREKVVNSTRAVRRREVDGNIFESVSRL
jgi:hypothetical protein